MGCHIDNSHNEFNNIFRYTTPETDIRISFSYHFAWVIDSTYIKTKQNRIDRKVCTAGGIKYCIFDVLWSTAKQCVAQRRL